jgi:hypothetical protein
MSRTNKTIELVLLGRSDTNIDFGDVRKMLDALGFVERIKRKSSYFLPCRR